MNIFLWIAQILLALHTVIGALWKFSHSAEETVPALASISPAMWLGLAGFELICAAGLIFPALHRRLGLLVPLSALAIAGEMLFFCGLHLYSGDSGRVPMFYWLVVALVSVSLAYARVLKRPL